MEPEGSLPCSQQPATGPLSWARWIQSTPSDAISVTSIPMLYSHLCQCFLNDTFPRRFSDQNFVRISHVSHVCHPPYLPLLDHHNNILWSIKIMMLLLIMQSSPASTTSPLLGPELSSAPCSHTPSIYVLPLMWKTKFYTHTKQEVKFYFDVF